MEVLVALGILIGLPLLFILPYWTIMSLDDWTDSPHLDAMEKWNMLNLLYLPYKTIMSIDFKPKSELDREIADEEKEIKFLTLQKEKINKLERLKRKKDSLYWEISKDEYKASSGETVYMPVKKQSADDLVGNLHTEQADIENLKMEEWHRCKQCGGTKVTGHRIIGGGYHEFCADCGTPINEMERIK